MYKRIKGKGKFNAFGTILRFNSFSLTNLILRVFLKYKIPVHSDIYINYLYLLVIVNLRIGWIICN